MKEIERYTVAGDKIGLLEHANGEVVLFSDYEQLQARIKELESEEHINKIKAQGIEEFIYIETEKSINFGDDEIFRSYSMARERLCEHLNKLRNKHE